MTHIERNLDVIKAERDIMNTVRYESTETQDFAVKSVIYLALQDISASLAAIADYLTEKDNKKEK